MYGQSLKYLFKIIVFFHLIYYGAAYHFNHISKQIGNKQSLLKLQEHFLFNLFPI